MGAGLLKLKESVTWSCLDLTSTVKALLEIDKNEEVLEKQCAGITYAIGSVRKEMADRTVLAVVDYVGPAIRKVGVNPEKERIFYQELYRSLIGAN